MESKNYNTKIKITGQLPLISNDILKEIIKIMKYMERHLLNWLLIKSDSPFRIIDVASSRHSNEMEFSTGYVSHSRDDENGQLEVSYYPEIIELK